MVCWWSVCQRKQSAILEFLLITSINCSTSRRFYTCSALTRHVILSTHLPHSLTIYLRKIPDVSLRRDVGKARHDLCEIPFLTGGHVVFCSHACPTKGLTGLLFRALSVLAIFQPSVFCSLSFSLPLSALSWHFATRVLWKKKKKRSFSCAAKDTNPPSCSHRSALCLRALPRLLTAHPSLLAIARSSSCTCPQRPIWTQTPPIFNSSLFIFICHHVRAVVHSVASPLPATFADFPHTHARAHTHTRTHARAHTHMRARTHTRTLKTQTHAKFQQVSST